MKSPDELFDVHDSRRVPMSRMVGAERRDPYEQAVRLIDQTIRPLFAESGRSADFPAYVAEVRTAHKPKRNLMKLIDGLEAADSQVTAQYEQRDILEPSRNSSWAEARATVFGGACSGATEDQSVRTPLDSLRMDPGDVVKRVRSPQGRIVELTARTWAYICKHAEMIERMDLLLEAIERPTLQEPDVIAGRERYWLRVTKQFEFAWVRVVVEFAGKTDRVVTAFGQNNPPAGSPE